MIKTTNKISFTSLGFCCAMMTLLLGRAFCVAADAESALDLSLPAATVFEQTLPDFGSENVEAMEKSQQRWQQYSFVASAPGNESKREEVNGVMTKSLAEKIDPVAKCWVLYQLRWTATDAEIPAVVKCLTDEDVRIRGAAARVLATLKTDAAKAALAEAKQTASPENRKMLADALDSMVFDYAIPNESEPPMSLVYADDATVADWMRGWEGWTPTVAARTIAALTARGDKKYYQFARMAIAIPDADVRRNGILAMEKLGSADDIGFLLDEAKKDDRELVVRVMNVMADPSFDAGLLAELNATSDPSRFGLVAEILANRSVTAAFAPILAGGEKWPLLRAELVDAAAKLATKNDIPALLTAMLSFDLPAEREQVERHITRLANGDGTEVIAAITAQNRSAVLPCLGRIGGAVSFAALNQSFTDGTDDEKAAALRGFCNWPNAEHADFLLNLATDTAIPDAAQVAALRAYLRVVSLPSDQMGIDADDAARLAMLKKGFETARRDDEKRLALDRVKSVRTPEALAFVRPFMKDKNMGETATATVLELAHHDFLRKESPDAFRAALNEVVATTTKQEFKDRAERYLSQMK